jgi:hypothetical protein
MQRTIAECSAKAATFLHEKRVAIDDSFVGVKKLPHTSSASIFQKEEVLNDRAEVERLDAVFAYNKGRMSPEEQNKYETDKQFSDIFEAMFADIAPQIFGEGVEVIVPSKFDDYKRQTDLIVVFKDAEGKPEASLVVDFTTQQDVEGFDTPDGRRGGLEQKWKRSLSEIAAKNQDLHSVKYARVHGVHTSLNYNPRILVGLSVPEIARLATLWKAGTLDIQKEPRIRELARSVRRQLIAQLHLADRNNRVQAKNRITRVLSVAEKRVKKIPDETGKVGDSDSVLAAINTLLTSEHRQALYAQAAAEKQEFESKLTPSVKAEWKKALVEPLTEGDASERARLEAHLKVTNPSGDILKEVNAFLAGQPHHLTKEMLPAVAGGVPTRLWRRLNEAVYAPVKTKEPEPKPKPSNNEGHGNNETHVTRLDAAAHLALLKKASGITEEKYAQLDTRGKRIWSFIKEKGIRALVAGVGAAIGSTFALALCAGALPSMLVALGGAVAGSLLGSHLLKKYYYDKHPDKDHTKDRARAAVIQSLARWAQHNPYSFVQYYTGPQGEAALKKAIERKVFLRNLAGNALAAGVGTVAGLEVRTGGQFTKTLLSGDFDALWKLFYCPPTQVAPRGAVRGVPPDGYVPQGRTGAGVVGNRYSGAGVDGLQRTPQNSLGRGMYSKGAMYTFETPRARLPAWLHQQCIGRCNTTAPFGYHSWIPGRVGSSGQQLYQLKYTPR